MNTPKQQKRTDQQNQGDKNTDQMQQGGGNKHKQPGQADKTVKPDAGVSRASTR